MGIKKFDKFFIWLSELMPTEKIMKCETIGRPRENQFLDSIRVTTQDDNRTPMRNRSDIPELGQNMNIPQISNNEPERWEFKIIMKEINI